MSNLFAPVFFTGIFSFSWQSDEDRWRRSMATRSESIWQSVYTVGHVKLVSMIALYMHWPKNRHHQPSNAWLSTACMVVFVIRQVRTDRTPVLVWSQTVWHSDSAHDFYENVNFEERLLLQLNKKIACKRLNALKSEWHFKETMSVFFGVKNIFSRPWCILECDFVAN